MTQPDKLYSLEDLERLEALGFIEWNGYVKMLHQLADVMRELEYYKKLAMNLGTGTAQPSSGHQAQYHPYKNTLSDFPSS